ncbi:MAG: hypothetical protein JWL70_1728 [Acidimicrobiia bacterium]|nr:hypothetical protein [Acidimicrobiia bacterium]
MRRQDPAIPSPFGDERRIGQRVRITDLAWTWEVPRPRGRFALGSARLVLQEARVVNLSVTGAGLLAPHNKLLHPGVRVAVLVGETAGVVQIRQVRSTFDEDSSYYGVRFVVLDDDLRRVLYDLVARDRLHLDPVWHAIR